MARDILPAGLLEPRPHHRAIIRGRRLTSCRHLTMSSTNMASAKGVEAGQGSIPMETLLEATAHAPELQTAIREADENGGA